MTSKKLEQWAASLKNNIYALYLVSIDDRVPKTIKALIGLIIAYALSPIDLIPDFIPILGYLDDLVLLPLGIWLVIRFVPKIVWKECQQRAKDNKVDIPLSHQMTFLIPIIWITALSLFLLWVWSLV